jgi:hypothetical protein
MAMFQLGVYFTAAAQPADAHAKKALPDAELVAEARKWLDQSAALGNTLAKRRVEALQ